MSSNNNNVKDLLKKISELEAELKKVKKKKKYGLFGLSIPKQVLRLNQTIQNIKPKPCKNG